MDVKHKSLNESLKLLTEALSKDDVIKNLVMEFNNHAPQFRINKISEITNSDRTRSFNYIRVLSFIVHQYISHNSVFEKDLTTDLKSIEDKLRLFISTLNENGKNGLHLNYLADNQNHDESSGIRAINSNIFLKIIYNDEIPVGALPLVKLEIIRNDSNKSNYFLPTYVLKELSDIFSSIHDDEVDQIQDYKNKINSKVIIYDD